MHVLMFLIGALTYLFAWMILGGAETAFQENTGFLIALIGTVFIAGAGIIDAINSNFRKLNENIKSLTSVNNAE